MPRLIWISIISTLLAILLLLNTTANSDARPDFLPISTPGTPSAPTADVLVEQARLLNNADRPTAALYLLNTALELDDIDEISLFRAHFQRGQLYQQEGDLERALSDYTEAIELQPTIAEVYAFRATVYFSLEDFEAALADYELALEYDAGQAAYYLAAGIVQTQLEAYDAAIESFTTALELDDELIIAYRERGLAALADDVPELARDDLETYLELSPDAADRADIDAILDDLR
jgi:tetratricopeptide (TPR) repeat protein